MELFSIPTGNLKLDGGSMFGIVPKVLWNRLYPEDHNNLINLSMRCLLIIQDNKVILIDNGIGNKQSQNFFDLYHLNGDDTLEKSLNKHGFSFPDITDVILTHLHFDHAGGSVTHNRDHTSLETTFPNASYWVSKKQWEGAINPNPREKASFLKENIFPIQESGQLKLIEEETELFPNISIKFSDGHTLGQLIPHINYKNKTIIFCGDLIPTSAHIPLPYVMAFDIHPLITMDEKNALLKQVSNNDYVLFFEHDIRHECCSVISTDKGFKTGSTFNLAEVL